MATNFALLLCLGGALPRAAGDDGDAPMAEKKCALCMGAGIVPLKKYKPYVHVEGQAAPKPEFCVPWQHCPKCRKLRDAKELVEIEKARLEKITPPHLEWERLTNLELVRVETRHVAFHCQFPAELAARQGVAAEKLTAYLQKSSRSVFLTPTRPDTFEIYFAWDSPDYLKMINVCQKLEQFRGHDDWSLTAKAVGFNGTLTSVNNALKAEKTMPPENLTVSSLAMRSISEAAQWNDSSWLRLGFAYFCERQIMSKNLIHYIDYEVNEESARLGDDWIKEIRDYVRRRQPLTPFDDMISMEVRFYRPPDHLTAFTMVTYLYSQPQRFLKFVQLIREGKEDRPALQEAYGMSVKKLQGECIKWMNKR